VNKPLLMINHLNTINK